MERRVIDMEKDPRREQFQLFSGYSFPYAGVTVQLDVTALELRLRAEHKPIFLTMLYVIHRAVNRVPELRRRIEDGQVVEYDECPVSFTEMKPDGSYAYCRMESARVPYEDYIAMGRVQQAAARQGDTIETDRRAESPSIGCILYRPLFNALHLNNYICKFIKIDRIFPVTYKVIGEYFFFEKMSRYKVCFFPSPFQNTYLFVTGSGGATLELR